MSKVFRVKKWYDDSVEIKGTEQKEYKAKRTGLEEVLNFITANDKNDDMVSYYNEVLAGEAGEIEFLARVEEYLLDVAQQNKEAGLHNDNRVIWKYLKIVK